MSTAWRPLLSALRSVRRLPARYLPVVGLLVGVIGGAVYWVAALFWPSSVAVVLSLSVTALIAGIGSEDATAAQPVWLDIFVLLIKYNALMALTAANLPYSVPENVALVLIMIAGQAASHGLLVSVLATRTDTSPRVSSGELGFAFAAGFAPAAALGIPGLAGLTAAIVMRLGLAASLNPRPRSPSRTLMRTVQPLTEACFYLGALATWKYV